MPRIHVRRIWINGIRAWQPHWAANGDVQMAALDQSTVCYGCGVYPLSLVFLKRTRQIDRENFSARVYCLSCTVTLHSVSTTYATLMRNRLRRWTQRMRRRERAMTAELADTYTVQARLDNGPTRPTQITFRPEMSPSDVTQWNLYSSHTNTPTYVLTDPLICEVVSPDSPDERLLGLHQQGYALGTYQRIDRAIVPNGIYRCSYHRTRGESVRMRQIRFRVHTVQGGSLAGVRMVKIEWPSWGDGWRAVAILPHVQADNQLIDYNGLLHEADPLVDSNFAEVAWALMHNAEVRERLCLLCNRPVRSRDGYQYMGMCETHREDVSHWQVSTEDYMYMEGYNFSWSTPVELEPPRSEIRGALVQ